MSIDYIVASLPSLNFSSPAPMTLEKFYSICEGEAAVVNCLKRTNWSDIETQLRNAMVVARGGNINYCRAANGCSLYWRNRVLSCFQEKDIAKREEALDKAWWDAAGELTNVTSPLGYGALATYAIRLAIVLKREKISESVGNKAFDCLTADTKVEF